MTQLSLATRKAATAEDMRQWGAALADVVRPGDLIILTGPLGAGKTVFTQGVGGALKVRGDVTSPTFVIARLHAPDTTQGRSLSLVHADAYRLGGALEVDDLDLDADLDHAVTIVEWGAGLVEQLADAHLEIRIDPDPVTEVRELTFLPVGGDWEVRLRSVLAA